VPSPDALPVLAFPDGQSWEAWLRDHHQTAQGVWVKIARAGGTEPSVTYDEVVEGALVHGWIDGQKRALDERSWLQRVTPRRARSPWSKRNRAWAERLAAQGRLAPAGRREVERAQADGRWERAYDGPRTASVPDDLQRELDRHPKASAFFATLDSANRYAVLYRVQTAHRPETRARRIQTLVAMLDRGETLH
jgi:uncharacterized protein YdeI (YjbR/CyaY-like superfamily)